jgi:hypothetical protein
MPNLIWRNCNFCLEVLLIEELFPPVSFIGLEECTPSWQQLESVANGKLVPSMSVLELEYIASKFQWESSKVLAAIAKYTS